MNDWIERAYITALKFYKEMLPRLAFAQRYSFKERCYAEWAIQEIFDLFDYPEDMDPSVIVEGFYQKLMIWVYKSSKKKEHDITHMFLTAAKVVRELSDYLALHGAY